MSTMPEEDRFFNKVKKTPGCWEWIAAKTACGYGKFAKDGGFILANRWVWEFHNKKKLGKLHALHKCHNPGCVRPDHIYAGTHQDNMRDMVRAGRLSDRVGEKNPNAKLTIGDIEAIRALQGLNQKKVAEWFDCSVENIRRIWSRKTWNHIA